MKLFSIKLNRKSTLAKCVTVERTRTMFGLTVHHTQTASTVQVSLTI